MSEEKKQEESILLEEGAESEKPRPIELNIFGQTYSFDDPKKLAETVEAAIRDAVIRGRLEAEQELKQRTGSEGQYVSGTEQPKTKTPDAAKFVELLEKNPAEAFDYVDEFRFGMPAKQVRAALNAVLKTTADMALAIEADKFRRETPEYVANEENMRALLETMRQYNLPPTAEGMKRAFRLAVDEGKIRPAQPQPFSPSAPPPSVGRSAASTGMALNWDKIRNLSADQLKAEIERIKNRLKQP